MTEEKIYALVRENVKQLTPYSSARDDFKGEASIFLDANENPFQTTFNRYPDPHQRALKAAIAKIKGVNPDNIFVGNGSDEAIDLVYRIFCAPGKNRVLIPQPTYGMYQVSASINDIQCDHVSLTANFELVSTEILQAVTTETKVIFLCSPNNPSGNLLEPGEIETILKAFNGIVVIDEAYIDFCDTSSWTTRLSEFPNLIVLQTLSKAWGLAGLRIGMAFAHVEIIALFDKVKPPYNVSGLTQNVALDILTTQGKAKKEMVEKIVIERNKVVERLMSLNIVRKIFPSDANFVLVQVENAKEVYAKLVKSGIIVRDRSNVTLCNDCLRITIGTESENEQLIDVMKQL